MEGSTEVIAKLRELAPNRDVRRTRLSRSGYDKGFSAAVAGEAGANPYRARHLPNFARGDNDPRWAWDRGYSDGERARDMLAGKLVRDVTWAEVTALPVHLQACQGREVMLTMGET